MINGAFLIFRNCNYCTKNPITFPPCWFCTLNFIHTLEKKWTVIPIERNTGVRFSKPVEVIGCWTEKNYFINGHFFVLESINGIYYPCSESMNSRYINVDSEKNSMCYWTIIMIKVNVLNTRNPIGKVACN